MDLWELHQYYFSPPATNTIATATGAPTGGLFAHSRTSSTSSIDSLVDRPTVMLQHSDDDDRLGQEDCGGQSSHMETSDCSVAASVNVITQPYATQLGLGQLDTFSVNTSMAGSSVVSTTNDQVTPRVRVSTSPRGRDHASTTTQSSTATSANTHVSSVSHAKRKHTSSNQFRSPSCHAVAATGSDTTQSEQSEEPWQNHTGCVSSEQHDALLSMDHGRPTQEQRPWKRAGTLTTMARIHYYPRLAVRLIINK